jgi:gamma-glutamyltranspeptidase/glutathione hydrolase
MVLGSPGGSKIITTVAQAIIAHRIFGLSAQEVVALPRFHHQWLPDVVYFEKAGLPIDVRQELIGRGHDVQEREPYGDLQVITITPGRLMGGASDPRGGGSVAGVGTGD